MVKPRLSRTSTPPRKDHRVPTTEPIAETPPVEPIATPTSTTQAATNRASDPGAREARIRDRAYRRYGERGGTAGEELQDWLDAEAEEQRDGPDTGKTASDAR